MPNGVCRAGQPRGSGPRGASRKEEGRGIAQSRQERLDRQRARQRAYRAELKARRKPSRDDIARTLLHFAITKNLARVAEDELFSLQQMIVTELVAQGFDKKAADAVFDDLVDKYRAGWTFQRKIHLRPQDTGGDRED